MELIASRLTGNNDSENWCRFIFKVGDKYYGVKTVNDDATVAHEFEFSK